jgi:RNA polymerase sigma factor (sigma-70 family)
MSRAFESLLVYLRRVSLPPMKRGTDSELLSRFVRFQDMVAFEVLFWRHGPMVWGVCRRLLGNSPDAEDAFQATFLVLARKARSVGNGAALAGWLHRVARHTALNARKSRGRRVAHERPLAKHYELAGQDDPSRQATDNELKALLDDELARLPEKFRLPLILCDMEARTHESVAAELNCPVGTLNSRLARARARLKKRLLRRGLPGAVLGGVAVPLNVASAALRTVSQVPSAPVLALAETVIWSLTLAAGKKVVGALAVCCVLAAGVAVGIAGGTSGEKDRPNEPAAATPIKQVNADEKLNFIDPDAGPLPPDAVARIGSPRLRHADEVTGLAYSPDGKWLASISTGPDDLTARLWDAATGKEQLRVKVAGQVSFNVGEGYYAPRALGFAANSQQFLVVDTLSIRSFDIGTGKKLFAHRLGADTPGNPIGAAVAPNGKTCVLAWSSGLVEIRDVATGTVGTKGSHPFENYLNVGVEISQDCRRFAVVAEAKHAIPVYEAALGRQVALVGAEGNSPGKLLFAPAGDLLVGLVFGDQNIKTCVAFFEGKTGKLLRTADVDQTTSVIAISSDGKLIAAGNGQKRFSELIDVVTGKEVGRIPSTPSLSTLAFNPDGNLLAGARRYSGAITVWDVAGRRYHTTAAEPTAFYFTTFSPDGQALVLPGRGRVSVDWRNGKVVSRLANVEPDGPITTVLSPDLRFYALPGAKGTIQLLDAKTGKQVRLLTGHTRMAPKLLFSRDGGRLASLGFDKVIRVWEVETGREIVQFKPAELHGQDPLSLSDDGRILAATFNQNGARNLMYTWNVNSKVQLARIEAPQKFFAPAELSPDGCYLAGGGGIADIKSRGTESDVTIWNALTGRVMHSLPGHATANVRPGAWCAFSPNSQLLATGDSAGRLRLWEVLSGQEVYRFEGHCTLVVPKFSPDGKLLVAASEDAPCFIWEVMGTTRAPQPAENIYLEQLWRDLADADAKKAFLAMRQLVARPEPAVELIRKKLKSAAGVDEAQIDKLLRDLDSSTYTVREAATAELVKIAEYIEPALTKARATAPLEVRARLDRILEKAKVPSSERLRQSRAVGTLEFIATPAAAKVLADLADGNRVDSLTAAAAAARERLRVRGGD